MQMEGKKLGGRYEIVSRVGGGGMAVVYKAKDLLLNRFVAIKVLNESLSNDSEFIRRFSREAQAAASLSHPNIVNVYDVGRDGYTHYIVMELVEGPTLKQYIQESGPLPVEEAAGIAVQICDGLAHAHENQIVHRDIKPHNILLGNNGRVKVTDFGIARAASSSTITQAGSVMGSVHYFSPEQARGGVIGEKSDIYSLGIVFYEMLTGQLPFDGDSAISIALQHLQEPVEDPRKINPNVPDNIASIVLRALEKDPTMRYTSAKAMMQDITYAVQLDRRMEPGWSSNQRTSKQGYYQAIPLALDDETEKNPVATAVEDSPYSSPTQRPEIRAGVGGGGGRKDLGHRPNPIGEKTMMNLERLRSVSNDQDKTIFQRTVVWLDNVQQNLPLWQKILFGFITVILIGILSLWGFATIWGIISGSGGKETKANVGNTVAVVVPKFDSVDQAKKFASDHGLPEPNITSQTDNTKSNGKILKQTPEPNGKATNDQPIQLVINQISNSVEVDDFVGKWESEAKQIASGKGYKIKLIYCNLNQGERAHIIQQSPTAHTKVAPGAQVILWEQIPEAPACKVTPPSDNSSDNSNQ